MLNAVRVAIETIGCKLNQAESEAFARQLSSVGCQIVSPQEETDIYILNTCTVTNTADRKCRQSLRRAHRRSPEAIIVAAGCYINRAGEGVLEEADIRIKNEDKTNIVEIVLGKMEFKTKMAMNPGNIRTRAFVKAQEGCNRCCAYCIVPLVRGREKSVSASEIIKEINVRVSEGYKEVVLTGTEIGSYNFDETKLDILIERILDETDIERLRISSLQPHEINDRLLNLWTDSRLCPHFHVSLQSGSDGVLKRMKRGYNARVFREAVNMIRQQSPEAAITTDVIVGFPEETDEEFDETVDLCREVGFARMHIFPYSSRPGTSAALIPYQFKAETRKKRMGIMHKIAQESAQKFRLKHIGKTMDVLWEQQSKGDVWSGYTSNYIRVYAANTRNMTNLITPAKLLKCYQEGLWGE